MQIDIVQNSGAQNGLLQQTHCSNGSISNNKTPIVKCGPIMLVKDEGKQKYKGQSIPSLNMKKCTSGASSISSIPGLDWDTQVPNIKLCIFQRNKNIVNALNFSYNSKTIFVSNPLSKDG